MLATLAGLLALVVGLGVLTLPLMTPELSRPRDAAWGALVLLLGLVLVTCADRLTGAPMLGVVCGGLLVGRLGTEVGQGRWRALSEEERSRLGSAERWQTSAQQLGASLTRLVTAAVAAGATVAAWIQQRQQPRSTGKRWIRPEVAAEAAAAPQAQPPAAPEQPEQTEQTEPAIAVEEPVEVRDFGEIDGLLEAAAGPSEVIEPEVIDQPDDDPR